VTAGRLLTARDVANRLGLSTETVLSWVRRGELPAFKLGRAIRFREADLDQWLQARATSADNLTTTSGPATLERPGP
jgi:excisionase family DNA binding protein